MENVTSDNCDFSYDDRKKTFDISHLHCLKTMSEISKLRSKSLLFDVVIKSDGRSFQVIHRNVFRFVNVGQDLCKNEANDPKKSKQREEISS